MSTRTPIVTTVVSTRALSPHLVRIVLQAEELRDFPVGEFTDHYVKLQLPPVDAGYSVPFDPAQVRETLDKSRWHRQRTYTVREADPGSGTITIDFVTHGSGLAGAWAETARPGDLAQIVGPGGGYAPDPHASWHLLAGDEAAIPAITVALDRMSSGARVFAVLEVEDEATQRAIEENSGISFPDGSTVIWLYRNGAEHTAEPRILRAVELLDLPADEGGSSTGQAFVHGEAGMVREVRRHLANDRGMALENLSATGYWKFRRTEEGWRADKPEWKRLAEADTA